MSREEEKIKKDMENTEILKMAGLIAAHCEKTGCYNCILHNKVINSCKLQPYPLKWDVIKINR